jgi:hypothetical protein
MAAKPFKSRTNIVGSDKKVRLNKTRPFWHESNMFHDPFLYKTVQLNGILKSDNLSGPDHLITGPFESLTQKVSKRWPFESRTVQLSDVYCTQKVYFQVVTSIQIPDNSKTEQIFLVFEWFAKLDCFIHIKMSLKYFLLYEMVQLSRDLSQVFEWLKTRRLLKNQTNLSGFLIG